RAAGLLVQNDSVAVHQHMAEELSAQGVIMTDMDTAVQQHSELVQEHFMAGGMSFAEDRFVALQGALWSGGLFLYVPKNVEVKLPFYFYQALTRQDGMVHPYHLVILESGAVATLYEEYASPSDDQDAGAHPYSGANTLMHLKDGSHLRLIVVQRWGTNVTEVSKHQALVGRDARFSGTSALIGGGKVNTRVRAELRGQGAHSEMHTLVLAAGKQHIDVVNENRHHNANTHGDMIAKQVLRDTCRTAFQGLIYIDENSPQSTDYLTENALVLDRGARADAIPGLEILNDDVQASHGATVGQLDEEQIFYLMARGIPRGEAEMLIVNGFFAPLLQRVPEEDTRDRLARFIQAKIKRES
ncbi:MAG: Fe-S cluster assembly protein SufD, partial [Thermaerobacterales bacterium]